MEGILQQLMWSLQALAQPADVQVDLFPDFVCAADELALDFDHWRECSLSMHPSRFSAEQPSALSRVDATLTEASEQHDADLWTPHALQCHPMWSELRALAEQALHSLGWPNEPPPYGRSTYVPIVPRDGPDR